METEPEKVWTSLAMNEQSPEENGLSKNTFLTLVKEQKVKFYSGQKLIYWQGDPAVPDKAEILLRAGHYFNIDMTTDLGNYQAIVQPGLAAQPNERRNLILLTPRNVKADDVKIVYIDRTQKD